MDHKLRDGGRQRPARGVGPGNQKRHDLCPHFGLVHPAAAHAGEVIGQEVLGRAILPLGDEIAHVPVEFAHVVRGLRPHVVGHDGEPADRGIDMRGEELGVLFRRADDGGNDPGGQGAGDLGQEVDAAPPGQRLGKMVHTLRDVRA